MCKNYIGLQRYSVICVIIYKIKRQMKLGYAIYIFLQRYRNRFQEETNDENNSSV
jgi:hypothetical protein